MTFALSVRVGINSLSTPAENKWWLCDVTALCFEGVWDQKGKSNN